MKTIQVGNLTIDGSRLFLIAGPCVIEGYDRTLMIGREVKRICEKLGVQYIFKASFDKANRSSYHSFRGPGLEEGLRILKSIKKELDVPVLSDVHLETLSIIAYCQPVTKAEVERIRVGYASNPRISLPPDRFGLRGGDDRKTGKCKKRTIHGA